MTDPREVALPPLPSLSGWSSRDRDSITQLLQAYARAAITAALAHREKEREEVAMYGWLREQVNNDLLTVARPGGWGGPVPWSGNDLDRAIKDAMSRTAGER